MVAQFDSEAAAHGLDRAAAIQRLKQNADPLAQKRGDAASVASARLARLEQQRAAMQDAGALGRLVVLVGQPDPLIAENALKTFEPAIPTTAEGAVIAGAGFFASYSLLRLLALPFATLFRRREKVRVRP